MEESSLMSPAGLSGTVIFHEVLAGPVRGPWQLLVVALLPSCFMTFPKPLGFPGPQCPPLQNGEGSSPETPMRGDTCQVTGDCGVGKIPLSWSLPENPSSRSFITMG